MESESYSEALRTYDLVKTAFPFRLQLCRLQIDCRSRKQKRKN